MTRPVKTLVACSLTTGRFCCDRGSREDAGGTWTVDGGRVLEESEEEAVLTEVLCGLL